MRIPSRCDPSFDKSNMMGVMMQFLSCIPTYESMEDTVNGMPRVREPTKQYTGSQMVANAVSMASSFVSTSLLIVPLCFVVFCGAQDKLRRKQLAAERTRERMKGRQTRAMQVL